MTPTATKATSHWNGAMCQHRSHCLTAWNGVCGFCFHEHTSYPGVSVAELGDVWKCCISPWHPNLVWRDDGAKAQSKVTG
jgi:hypothetical protein